MNEDELVAAISGLALVEFLVLAVAIGLRQADRVRRHRRLHREPPELLLRDLVFFWVLMILLAVPTVAGLFGETLGDKLWWVLARTVLGSAALLVFAGYEYLRIGRDTDE